MSDLNPILLKLANQVRYGEPTDVYTWDTVAKRVLDAVLPAVVAERDAEIAGLRSALAEARKDAEAGWRHAERREGEAEDWASSFVEYRKWAAGVVAERDQLKAAIDRVRALLEPAPDGAVFAVLRGGDGEEYWQAVVPRDALIAALDQPAQQQGDGNG